MFDRIKTLVDRWRDANEVASLTDRDLADLGMTRDQVEAFVRMPQDVPDRVTAMAAIFGLSEDQIKADHDGYTDLLYTCGQCKDRAACRQVLDRAATARPTDAPFCLNKTAFESAA
jgi:hypothetical protein